MKEQLERRRQAVGRLWGLKDEVVLIGAGLPIRIPGRSDQEYPFRAHSEYLYLTDQEGPGGVLAFDPTEGWTDFFPQTTPDEEVWTGSRPKQDGRPLSDLQPWIEARKERQFVSLGSPLAGVRSDTSLETTLRQQLDRIRRPKDESELQRMRKAAQATAAGFKAIQPLLVPGTTERQLQIEIEAAFFRDGADGVAYDTIVGSGPNSAVLHFKPTRRSFAKGEFVLIDAGAEYQAYACDVTRTYVVSGQMREEQSDLYDLVLAVEKSAIDCCTSGTEYKEVHLAASLQIAQGLIDFGLLRGRAESLVEQGTHVLFFPHGIGHMVGLGVRDAGGYLPPRIPGEQPGLRYLRIDLPLEPNFVVTIEPGIYFIPALLEQQKMRQLHRDTVDWPRVDRMLGFGGIRIEDNVRVTQGRPEILTADIPK